MFFEKITSIHDDPSIQIILKKTRGEVAAAALLRLWRGSHLDDDDPLVFLGARRAHNWQYQEHFLNILVERSQQPAFQQIVHWERLKPPAYAYGIAENPLAGPLRKNDYLQEASSYDQGTVSSPVAGWYRYTFATGWSAFSVMLPIDEDDIVTTITLIPQGKQDAWQAFLHVLGGVHSEVLQYDRRGRIDILGGESDEESVIANVKGVTLEDVILPEEILAQMESQRRIFSPDMLQRYASFRIPRIRKVLFAGPPGTGKTTFLRALSNQHTEQGGYVIYVFAAKKAGHSWENLYLAMLGAAESHLPTLIIVEDFEHFVSDAEDMQHVLNTLDGIATPDNPAGTLLLATTNAPEKIDPRIKDRPGRIDTIIHVGPCEAEDLVIRFLQRFLGDAYCGEEHAPVASNLLNYPGSHIREACLLAMIHALDENREKVLGQDLLWAHESILQGRALIEEPERFTPAPAKKRLGMNFRKQK